MEYIRIGQLNSQMTCPTTAAPKDIQVARDSVSPAPSAARQG